MGQGSKKPEEVVLASSGSVIQSLMGWKSGISSPSSSATQ